MSKIFIANDKHQHVIDLDFIKFFSKRTNNNLKECIVINEGSISLVYDYGTDRDRAYAILQKQKGF